MKVTRSGPYTVTITPGEFLDVRTSREIEEILQPLCDEVSIQVTIDFQQVKVIDSTGLGKLIYYQKKLMDNDGELIITNAHYPTVKRIIEMIQLKKLIRIIS